MYTRPIIRAIAIGQPAQVVLLSPMRINLSPMGMHGGRDRTARELAKGDGELRVAAGPLPDLCQPDNDLVQGLRQ